ncbi:MAG: hypothetical protein HYS86_01780 [Candidatus Chisholmbacteria bacterium]|nr:hypothetical protein [Candidatus Chisholmbacteria bacterium]
MKLTNIARTLRNNKVRLSAELILNSGKKHTVYFEIEKKFKDLISTDASPFLPASLLMAMKKNENLEIDGSISEKLSASLPKVMKMIDAWYFGFKPISVVPRSLNDGLNKTRNVGCFFSGGVDSFYTYLRNKKKVSHLIFVHGFDIKVNNLELYKKVERNILKIAAAQKVELVRVRTNAREILDKYFDWDPVHPFALASVALFLHSGFREIYMSCGQTGHREKHSYMIPDMDVLWSTEGVNVVHFGCRADKIAKLRLLSKSRLAKENLRVCWVNRHGQYNCSECEKCFRNMLALYAIGTLAKFKTFNPNINLGKLKNIKIDHKPLAYFMTVLNTLRRNNDTSPVRDALEACIKNNQSPSFDRKLFIELRNFVNYFDKKYNQNRLYWFLAKKNFI